MRLCDSHMDKGEFSLQFKPSDQRFMERYEKTSTRVSTVLNNQCNGAIDFFIIQIGIYNGKSDFVNSAIKAFYLEFSEWAVKELKPLKEQYPDYPAKILKKFGEKAKLHVKYYLDLYVKNYTDESGEQYSFRVSSPVHTRINEIATVSSMSRGDIIRAATTYFLDTCGEKRRIVNDFADEYWGIYKDAYGED